MLTPEQVRPFLLHKDPHVRTAVWRYFGESQSRDPELLPLVFESWDRYGEPGISFDFHHCRSFVVTEASFERVLEKLATTKGGPVRGTLAELVVRSPVEILAAREEAVAQAVGLGEEARERIKRRLELAQWSDEKLWEELQEFARRSDDKQYVGEIDHDYSDDLVEALGLRSFPDDATLCQQLGSAPEDGWLQIFLVQLVGERRVSAAIPQLVAMFRIDTDLLLEQAIVSLSKIADPEAPRLVGDLYRELDDDRRLMPTEVFGRIKHPASEEAVLDLLKTDEDLTLRTFLCMALCELFSERGIAVVEKEIENGYDSLVTTLEQDLLPVLEVLGKEHPEADRWMRQREKDDARKRRHQAETERFRKQLESSGPTPQLKVRRPLDARRQPDSESSPRPQVAPAPAPEPVVTFRRAEAKIGRNDPCPCGSGKKYKKCCGINRD